MVWSCCVIPFILYETALRFTQSLSRPAGVAPSIRRNPRVHQNQSSTDCHRHEGEDWKREVCFSMCVFFNSNVPCYMCELYQPQDAKINSMDRSLRDMEEELLMLKSNGLLSCEERQEEMKQMEVYRSHTKFMKNKVWDNMKWSLAWLNCFSWLPHP